MNKAILFLFFVLGLTSNATAMSCAPFEHRYVVLCDASSCRGAFGVREVPGFRSCSRRPVVDDLDERVGSFLGRAVWEARAPKARGLYVIRLPVRWWGVDSPGTLEGLIEILRQILSIDESRWQDFNSMPIAEMVAQLNERHEGWLEQMAADPSLEVVEAERSNFEARAMEAHVKNILLAVAYWLSALVALLAFVHSVHVYFLRLHDLSAPRKPFALIRPVATQIAIAGIGGAVLFLDPFEFWFGTLLLPAAVIILLAEGWARFQRRNVGPGAS